MRVRLYFNLEPDDVVRRKLVLHFGIMVIIKKQLTAMLLVNIFGIFIIWSWQKWPSNTLYFNLFHYLNNWIMSEVRSSGHVKWPNVRSYIHDTYILSRIWNIFKRACRNVTAEGRSVCFPDGWNTWPVVRLFCQQTIVSRGGRQCLEFSHTSIGIAQFEGIY